MDIEGGGLGEVVFWVVVCSVELVGGVCECWGRCWLVFVLFFEWVVEECEW